MRSSSLRLWLVLRGLTGGGFERDGEIAGMMREDLGGRGEAEDVSGLVLVAEGAVEAFELGV
jgi:hypothetical protein